MRILLFALASLFTGIFLVTPSHLPAQALRIECTRGLTTKSDADESTCEGLISRLDSLPNRQIVLRITRNGQPVKDAVVRFSTTVGKVHPETDTTGGDGTARTMWFGDRRTERVGIAVAAEATGASALRYIELVHQPESPRGQLRLERFSGTRQSWFENTALRNRVVFRIAEDKMSKDKSGKDTLITVDIPKEAESVCKAQRVVFRPYSGSGSATPDTSFGQMYPYNDLQGNSKMGCLVDTRWALGAGVGPREMLVTLTPRAGFRGSDTVSTAKAFSRSPPRIIGGVAQVWVRSYPGLAGGGERTARIERVQPDGSTITVDTTITDPTAFKEFDGKWEAVALVGLNTSVPLSYRWLYGFSQHVALTGGVDLKDFRNHWFAGASLARLAYPLSETLPVDVHILAHWRRNRIVKDPQACQNNADCTTENDVRFQGIGFMLSADASTLISEVIKRLTS